MAVSDLTGTKWVLNNWDINLGSSNVSYNINFTSNSTYYELLRVFDSNYDDDPPNCIGYGDEGIVYKGTWIVYNGAWYDQAYRIISITGGTDATNADLITWLEANAVQQVAPTPSQTNNIFFGTSAINKVYFGTSEVSKIYYGNTLIYEGGGSGN